MDSSEIFQKQVDLSLRADTVFQRYQVLNRLLVKTIAILDIAFQFFAILDNANPQIWHFTDKESTHLLN